MKNFIASIFLTFNVICVIAAIFYYQGTHKSYRVIEKDLADVQDSLNYIRNEFDSLNTVYSFYVDRLEINKHKLRLMQKKLTELRETQIASVKEMKLILHEIQFEVDTSFEKEEIELFLFE